MKIQIRPAVLLRRQATHDEFVAYLANNVAALQHRAVRLQSAGMAYGTIVVPRRFEKVVSEGQPTLLGRKVIAGDVESIGVLITA